MSFSSLVLFVVQLCLVKQFIGNRSPMNTAFTEKYIFQKEGSII
jgi:hypothetical protein